LFQRIFYRLQQARHGGNQLETDLQGGGFQRTPVYPKQRQAFNLSSNSAIPNRD
jgi:hypothetical protein